MRVSAATCPARRAATCPARCAARYLARRAAGYLARCAALAALCLALVPAARAGGPRFVSGTQYGNLQGQPMAFFTAQPLYFTDPGALNATVSHAQADALVAAAAAVWNVPTTSLVLQQGGTLAEHVSSANTSLGNNGVAFPADVLAANYAAIPIAIVYDTDGSITDLLLGSGASSPLECRQNGVTESVDSFGADATIHHAVLVLNGRCVGSAPQQLLQLQYQLMRAFGRILGLAWAQVNDNVFTGVTQPTAAQMANWPVMHPIDVVCGPYTYQCMQNPFQLRPDDLSSLALLYPLAAANLPAGKTPTLANADKIEAWVTFPTLQGMQLLNVTVTEVPVGQPSFDPWQTASAVSGIYFAQNAGNPISGPEPAQDNVGTPFGYWDAYLRMAAVPLVAPLAGLRITEESINPLYTGDYALGPYQRPPTTRSGAAQVQDAPFAQPGQTQQFFITMADAPVACNPTTDGTETAPAAPDPSGFTAGLLCGFGHTAWFTTTVQANRTWTLETTALDETGAATVQKAQPVLGLWNAADPTGQPPTVAAQPVAMNALAMGVTQLQMPAQTGSQPSAQTLRIAVADQFGGGRPDFAYSLRVLYADHLQPTIVGAGGGQITITGTGFRAGNQVLINGVRATVVSSNPTQLVAIAPPMTSTSPVDVEVFDARTGGSTTMLGVLTYDPTLAGTLALTPAGTAYIAAGATLQIPLTLQATQGVSPDPALPIAWSTAGAVALSSEQTITSAAGSATATAAITAIPGGVTGTVTACAWTSVCANWSLVGVDPAAWAVAVTGGAGQSVAVGTALAPVSFLVTDGVGHPLQAAPVTLHQAVYAWEGACPAASDNPCPAAPVLATRTTTATTDANGLVQLTPLTVPNQPQTVQIAAATGTFGFITLSLVVTP